MSAKQTGTAKNTDGSGRTVAAAVSVTGETRTAEVRSRRAAWALYALVFVCGATIMGIEIAGSRILAPGFGTSLFVWGSLIGLFMGAMACGYWSGGWLADRRPSFALLAGIVATAGLYTGLIPQFGPSLCTAVAKDALLGPKSGPFVAAAVLFFAPSFLLAMVSPFAVKLYTRSLQQVGGAAGKLYALSTVGSIVGTLATAFLFIPLWFTGTVLLGFGAALIVAAAFCLSLFRSAKKGLSGGERLGVSTMLLAALALTEFGLLFPPEPRVRDDERLLYYEDSSYHEIAVTEEVMNQGRLNDPAEVRRWLKFNDNIESGIYPYADHYVNAVHYTDLLHLALLWRPDPRHVLVIGGGGAIIPRQYRDFYPHAEIEVAEIDPAVMRVCKRYFQIKEDARLRFLIGDGRRTLRRSKKKYDIVVIDAYTSGGQIPFHLMTWEFYREVRDHLTPRGVLIYNLITALRNPPRDADRPADLLLAQLKTLRASEAEALRLDTPTAAQQRSLFTQTYVFPKIGRGDSWKGGEGSYRNVIVVATREKERLSYEEITARARKLTAGENPTVKIPAEVFRRHAGNLYEMISAADLETVPLLSDGYAPVDSMYRPVKRTESSYKILY